jgi:hypothetical protein
MNTTTNTTTVAQYIPRFCDLCLNKIPKDEYAVFFLSRAQIVCEKCAYSVAKPCSACGYLEYDESIVHHNGRDYCGVCQKDIRYDCLCDVCINWEEEEEERDDCINWEEEE